MQSCRCKQHTRASRIENTEDHSTLILRHATEIHTLLKIQTPLMNHVDASVCSETELPPERRLILRNIKLIGYTIAERLRLRQASLSSTTTSGSWLLSLYDHLPPIIMIKASEPCIKSLDPSYRLPNVFPPEFSLDSSPIQRSRRVPLSQEQ